jgi:hypothetical protein
MAVFLWYIDTNRSTRIVVDDEIVSEIVAEEIMAAEYPRT